MNLQKINKNWYAFNAIAWNTFKNTGNINTFLELLEVENAEKNLQKSDSNITNIEVKDDNKMNNL